MNRIKSLDGIRAISILMVTAGHALLTLPAALSQNKLVYLCSNASLGVQIFFVISGYLITKLLLKEREKNGKINLKAFYIRRIRRIFPVFFLYIAVLVLLKNSILPNAFEDYTLILFASLYLWNYKHYFIQESPYDNGNFYLSHFWSLSMEEQFYLLWPVTLAKTNTKTLIKIALGIMLLMPLIRIATYFLMPGSRPQVSVMLHTGGDTIIMGCLGALLEDSLFFRNTVLKYIKNNLIILGLFIFLFIISPLLTLYLKGMYLYTVGQTCNNISIMLLLFWCIYIPSKVSNVLNSKPFVQIGLLSYSLYIWQPLFLTEKTHFWINQFPQNIVAVFVVAFVSYHFIEKYFIKRPLPVK